MRIKNGEMFKWFEGIKRIKPLIVLYTWKYVQKYILLYKIYNILNFQSDFKGIIIVIYIYLKNK